MTYRASLGTRGELRRIAAEAESVTIDHVRPWIRKVQPCRLAPHVIVPQWLRLEKPVKPKPPPPLVSQSHIASSELVEELLDSATAKKFRRGRGRRGRPRKRAESAANSELKPADAEDATSGQMASEPLSAAAEAPEIGNETARETVARNNTAKEAENGVETTREAEMTAVPLPSDENKMDTENAEVSVPAETHQLNVGEATGNEIAKQSEAENETQKDAEMSVVPPASDENVMDAEKAKVSIPGENHQPNMGEGARNEMAKETEDRNEKEKEVGAGDEVAKESGTGNEMEKEAETGNETEKELGTGIQKEVEPGLGNEIEKEPETRNEIENASGAGNEMERASEVGDEIAEEPSTGNEAEKEAEMSAILPVTEENAMDTGNAKVSAPGESQQPNVGESSYKAAEQEQQDPNEGLNEDIRSTDEPQLEKPHSLVATENPLVPGEYSGDPGLPNTLKDAPEEPKTSEDVEMAELAAEPTEM